MILKGIRVLDFTQYLAGPTTTRLMAEMGADVIKVERAKDGDPSRLLPVVKNKRSGYFVQQNLGKRSLCIDLKSKESKKIVLDLVNEVDVVIENFGPGVMEKRGWGFKELKKINKKLVMASISAFGRDSLLSHKTGFDWIAQAFAGIMDMTGPEKGSPHPVGVGIADISAGVHAFAAVGYALFNRERTGEGQWSDISMVDCLFHAHEVNLQVPQLTDGAFVPKRMGAHHKLLCPCGVFNSPEGHIVILCTQGQWVNLCKAMEKPELEKDSRFSLPESRVSNQDRLIAIIEEWMTEIGKDETILRKLESNRVPSSPVLSPIDALEHPYFNERGTVRVTTDRILGTIKLPGFPLRFSDQKNYKPGNAPFLGEHNSDVLKEVLGYSEETVRGLYEKGVLYQENC